MANKRIINGKDTLTRIQGAWDFIVSNGKHPTVTEFAKMAQISYSTFTHKYKDFADKVRDRRDKKRGKKRNLSPATLPKNTVSIDSFKQAEEQINHLQKEVSKLRKDMEKAEKQLRVALPLAAESEKFRKDYGLLLGAMDYLYSQLKMRGVTNEQLRIIRQSVEKHIYPVSGGTNE